MLSRLWERKSKVLKAKGSSDEPPKELEARPVENTDPSPKELEAKNTDPPPKQLDAKNTDPPPKEWEDRLIKSTDLTVSLDGFPYYLDQETRDMVVHCASAHLQHPELMKRMKVLDSTSPRIVLHGPPGSEIYQETLAMAVAKDLNASFLSLYGNLLSPYKIKNKADDADGQENDEIDEAFVKSKDKPQLIQSGDYVKFVGSNDPERHNLKNGQLGSVVFSRSSMVAVKFESTSCVTYCRPEELQLSCDSCCNVINHLQMVLERCTRLVVYFPDPEDWFRRAVAITQRKEFLEKLQDKLDMLSGGIVLIASKINAENKCSRLPEHTGYYLEDIYSLFENKVKIVPPKDKDMLQKWQDELKSDSAMYRSKTNTKKIEEVLDLFNWECKGVKDLKIPHGVSLTDKEAERIVGYTLNIHISQALDSASKGSTRTSLSLESLQLSADKLEISKNTTTKILRNITYDEYETMLLPCVIAAGETGVSFRNVGGLKKVKATLQELLILPLTRPKLFSKGNLLKPCRGMLLFGPPGTGKTHIAKAIASEANTAFISITSSTISSMWYGEAEKLAKAVFTLAEKLAPTIIFVDEVDSILGARGELNEDETSRSVKNEFMTAWDGLRTKDDKRVMLLAATNRPFDLDEAVIRRLPRRILISLPKRSSRVEILKVLLEGEKLDNKFDLEELGRLTTGYSGSDLKNLCTAAAYVPVRELLAKEAELNEKVNDDVEIRPLCVDDFKKSMCKVCPTARFVNTQLEAWNQQYGEVKEKDMEIVNGVYQKRKPKAPSYFI